MTGPATVQERDLDLIHEDLAGVLPALAGRRVLITGGAGFLGYYLVQTLTEWNRRRPGPPAEIMVWDNGRRGVPPWLSELGHRGHVTLQPTDVSARLPALPPLDWVIHAAGIASPTVYRRYPLETMDANVNGLRQLLDVARAQADAGHPVSGFLFLSSSEIYGDPDPQAIPTPEDYRGSVSCTGPRACYDESKRYGETLAVVFARTYGVPVTIARPFNNYGPGLRIDDGRVIPDFSRCVLDGRDIVMHSDGSPTRTFCYSADAVCGYFRVLVRGRPGEPYNIGTEAPEVSMAELAGRLQAIGRAEFGYGGAVITAPSPDPAYLVDNPRRRCPVITKARDHLGYHPRVDLDEGLRRSLWWYDAQRRGQR